MKEFRHICLWPFSRRSCDSWETLHLLLLGQGCRTQLLFETQPDAWRAWCPNQPSFLLFTQARKLRASWSRSGSLGCRAGGLIHNILGAKSIRKGSSKPRIRFLVLPMTTLIPRKCTKRRDKFSLWLPANHLKCRKWKP